MKLNELEKPMDWGFLQKKFVEPSEEFTVGSQWSAQWIPKWYDQDQGLAVGRQQEYLFYENVPGWDMRYMARNQLRCPALVFRGNSDASTVPIIVLVCEILEIHNAHWGAVRSIQADGSFDFAMSLESGRSHIVNTEEHPGAIWDETAKEWITKTQEYDWSMAVQLRIVDRDPQRIFGVTAFPKPFCMDDGTSNTFGFALHDAAQSGDINKVRQLIDRGINVNEKNGFGDTPLFRAARKEHIDIVRLLLGAGAKPNTQNRTGWGPLHTAAVQGYGEVVQTLLESGAYVDIRNKNGWTPLFMASGSGQLECVRLLLEAGADIHAEDAAGNTPTLNAQKKGYQNVAALLKTTVERE